MIFKLLFDPEVGLLSLFTILFMLGMAAFIFTFVRGHMREEREAAEAQHKLGHSH